MAPSGFTFELPWETDISAGAAVTEASTSDGSWECLETEEMPGPRFDRHGFRRDTQHLEREEAFEMRYAVRLEQQEQRWSRHGTLPSDGMAACPSEAGGGIRKADLKRLARLGIPARRRQLLWPRLVRAEELKGSEPPGYYESLLAMPRAAQGDEGYAAERQIELDLARTFPGHRLLSTPDGETKLRSVLIAYSRRDPVVGYVQGMGFVAALLLVFVDEPEDAFWCLACIVEWLLPKDFYSPTLLGLRTEQAVFSELVASKLPRVAAQFETHGIIAELFATRWYAGELL